MRVLWCTGKRRWDGRCDINGMGHHQEETSSGRDTTKEGDYRTLQRTIGSRW